MFDFSSYFTPGIQSSDTLFKLHGTSFSCLLNETNNLFVFENDKCHLIYWFLLINGSDI